MPVKKNLTENEQRIKDACLRIVNDDYSNEEEDRKIIAERADEIRNDPEAIARIKKALED
jgi:hypothetical protein